MKAIKTTVKERISGLRFIPELCDFCGCCVAVCPVDCIELEEARLTVDLEVCILCGNCPPACPVGALVGEVT